jgi:hypothetical protein
MKRKKVSGWILCAILLACGIIGVLFFLSLPILPISIAGIWVAVFLGILVVGLFWYMFFYKGDDESSKYRGIIMVVMILTGLLGCVAFVVAFEKPIPISVLQFWLLIELGLLLFIVTLALLLAIQDYESTSESLRRYWKAEEEYREIERQRRLENDEEES